MQAVRESILGFPREYNIAISESFENALVQVFTSSDIIYLDLRGKRLKLNEKGKALHGDSEIPCEANRTIKGLLANASRWLGYKAKRLKNISIKEKERDLKICVEEDEYAATILNNQELNRLCLDHSSPRLCLPRIQCYSQVAFFMVASYLN